MKVIKADHEARIVIPGVPAPTRRPVDIDKSRTGFANLRSLRIYRFDKDSTIDGHAEEDEVFVVALSGSVALMVTGDNSGEECPRFTLSAPNGLHGDPCVAYLPPHSAYQLIPKSEAEIAYARATPDRGSPSNAFTADGRMDAAGVTVLLKEDTYAQRLRLRLVHVNATQGDVEFEPILESDAMCEALLHARWEPPDAAATITGGGDGPILLESWDTVAVAAGERPTLHIAMGASVLILVVLARE